MQFKSFMEALKGKQHKIDKNKNGEIDAHDFKLLRKEEAEETIEESEERMARADYKVGPSGRKSHKEIVFNDAESKDDEEDKKEMKEAKMSDADMAERERIVKGMKKNLTGFKARYGDRAKEVMYATATKQAMKEETVEEGVKRTATGLIHTKDDYESNPSTFKDKEDNKLQSSSGRTRMNKIIPPNDKRTDVDEAVQKADIPAYLRKQQGQAPLKLSDLKRKDTISDKENLAKARGVKEEVEQLDELSPDTLKSYVNKAKPDYKIAKQDTRAAGEAGDDENFEKSIDRQMKRRAGIKTAKAKLNKEEVEQIDEKSDQAKRNKIMKNVMTASKGAQINRTLKLDPTEYGYKRAQHLNVAIGRQMMKAEEVKKDDVPFDGPYTKTKPVKNSDGTTQSPMSRARQLAKDAMKKQMKEDIDRLFEKDDTEYDYEGEMAVTQLKTIIRHAEALQAKMQPDTNLPEWVQSKITLATDYIQTASDYLHSELEEQAPVAPVPDKKYIKGTPEHKAYKATKKPINGMPTNVKESFDADGNIINSKVSYKEFAMMLEYETKDGRYVHKGTYGGTYVDPEGADDADDKKPKQQPADKRGRGRPAGAKSGARKITGTSKLFK
jgi:hypothetical protein